MDGGDSFEPCRCIRGMGSRTAWWGVRLAARAWLLAAVCLAPRLLAAQPSRAAGAVAVSGTVYDSIARRVLPGVTVQYIAADSLSCRGFYALTDSAGRYRLTVVPAWRLIAG